MQSKRGQFYLIAAVVIISLVAGFVAVSNYIYKEKFNHINNLATSLKIESEKVLEYSVVNGKDFDVVFENFTKTFYETNKEDDLEIYFLYGPKQNLKLHKYSESGKETLTANVYGDTAVVNIDDADYEFELFEGKNIYFIISKEEEGERYIITNKDD